MQLPLRLFILLLSIIPTLIIAQRHTKCGSNPVSLANFCDDACLVCDLNGVTAQTTNTIVGQSPPGYCTMVEHSMQWLAFVAGTPNLSLNVAVSACTQNNGVEMGIYASDDCSVFRLVSNCNTNMFNNQTWAFTNTEPLKVGCTYYLVFDGNGPNSCFISISVTSGSTVAPSPNTTDKISGRTLVCVGETVEYIIPPILGACSYEWRVVNGTIADVKDNKVSVTWDQVGMGKVCVIGSNECKRGNEVCLDVEIGDASPPKDLGPFTVCYQKFYLYNGNPLSNGTWPFMYKNKYGCDSIINVIVEELPENESQLDTAVCFPNVFKIGPNQYDSSGIYRLELASKVAPYCDSTVYINLKYTKIFARISKSNDISCTDTFSILSADSLLIPSGDTSYLVWKNEAGDSLSNQKQIRISQTGTYTLIIKQQNSNCSFTQQITVKGSRLSPKLVSHDTIRYCVGDTIDINNITIVDSNNTNASLSFHTDITCTAQNQISNNQLVLLNDSTIYVLASNGVCKDILPITLRTNAIDNIIGNDIIICNGQEIDLSKIILMRNGNPNTIPSFYVCPVQDVNCKLITALHRFNSDTTIYIYPENSLCPDWTSFKITVNPIPSAEFTFSKDTFCLQDIVLLILPNRLPSTNLNYSINSINLVVSPNTDTIKAQLTNIGLTTICMRSEAKSCRDTVCKTIVVTSPPVQPILLCESTDSTIIFYWKKYTDELYVVNILTGQNFIWLSDTSVLISNLMQGEKVQIQLEASTPYCNAITARLECESKSCPPVNIQISKLDSLCLKSNSPSINVLAIADNPMPTDIWTWSGTGITDSIRGLFSPGVSGIGTHIITATLLRDGCPYKQQTTITVIQNPIATFNVDSTICIDSVLQLKFTGQAASTTRFNWNFNSATVSEINRNVDYRLSWNSPGQKILSLVLQNFQCVDSITTVVRVYDPLPQPILKCLSNDTAFIFTWSKDSRAKTYRVLPQFGNNGIFLNDSTYSIRKRSANDSAAIQVQVEDIGPCGNVISQIVRCACPLRNIAVDTSINICADNPVQIDLHTLLNERPTPISWQGQQIQNDSIINTTNLNNQVYTYFLSGSISGCKYFDTIVLKKYASPSLSTFELLNDVCDSNALAQIINLSSHSENPPIEYSINNQTFSQQPNFTNLTVGNYTLVIRDKLKCKSDTLIQITKSQIPNLDLGPDLIVPKGTTIDLTANISGPYSHINWITSFDLSCVNCTDPFFTADQSDYVLCEITNDEGCKVIDSMRIRIFQNKVFAPNAISPNFDKINDIFTLYGNVKEIVSLDIYDRWGEKVFSKQHFPANSLTEGWDGTFRNKHLQNGVFVYHAVVSFEIGENEVITGDFTLMR